MRRVVFIPWFVVYVLFLLLVVVREGEAEASPFQRLGEVEVTQVLDKVIAARGSYGRTVTRDQLLSLAKTNALLEVTSAQCPTITVRVNNVSDHLMMSVPVRLRKTAATMHLSLHIPVIPARSFALATFDCKSGASSVEQVGLESETTLGSAPTPALVQQQSTNVGDANFYVGDANFSTVPFSAGLTVGHVIFMSLNLLSDDTVAFNELVKVLLGSSKGTDDFLTHLRRGNRALLKSLTADTVAVASQQTANVLLVEAIDLPDEPGPGLLSLVQKVCGTPSEPSVQLWMSSLSAKTTPLATQVSTNCRPTSGQVRKLMAGVDSTEAGRVLGAVAIDDFTAAAEGLKTNKRVYFDIVLRALITETQEGARLSRAVGLLAITNDTQRADLVDALAISADGKALAEKQKLLREMLQAMGASVRNLALKRLLTTASKGEMKASATRDEISEMIRREPSIFADVEWEIRTASKRIDAASVLDAWKNGKLDLLSFLHINGTEMAGCSAFTNANFAKCDEAMGKHFRDVPLKLAPDFAQDMGKRVAQVPAADVAQIVSIYAPFGLDTRAVADELCKHSAPVIAQETDVAMNELLGRIRALDANHPCLTSVPSARTMYAVKRTGQAIGFVLALVGVIVLAGYSLKRKWKPVRAMLGDSASSKFQWARGILKARLDLLPWHRGFDTALEELRNDLKRADDEAHKNAALALEKLQRATTFVKWEEQVRQKVVSALKTGSLRSLLAKIDDILVYALVFPARHDDPRSIRRYESLAEGWPVHSAKLQEIVRFGEDAQKPLVTLFIFLRPDASDGVLLFGYDDGQSSLLPGLLLEEAEVRSTEGIVHSEAYMLALPNETT